MIIDFHAHAYDPAAAARIRAGLGGDRWNGHAPPPSSPGAFPRPRLVLDGSPESLVSALDAAGVARSTVLPVAHRPERTRQLNDWALEVCAGSDRLIPFASLHPDDPEWPRELARVVEAGAVGIKLHPQLQTRRSSDCLLEAGYLNIFEACERSGVPVVTCTYFPREVATRSGGVGQRLRSVLGHFPRLKLVAAHMGAMYNWQANQELIGTGAYLDLAYVPGLVEDRELVRMIRAHGADRVLFGSDAPYAHPKRILEGTLGLGLDDDELELILGRNAERLIGPPAAAGQPAASRTTEDDL